MRDLPPLLTSAEVAALFGVNAKTVVWWVRGHRLPAWRTPGGRYRFRRDDVLALVVQETRHG